MVTNTKLYKVILLSMIVIGCATKPPPSTDWYQTGYNKGYKDALNFMEAIAEYETPMAEKNRAYEQGYADGQKSGVLDRQHLDEIEPTDPIWVKVRKLLNARKYKITKEGDTYHISRNDVKGKDVYNVSISLTPSGKLTETARILDVVFEVTPTALQIGIDNIGWANFKVDKHGNLEHYHWSKEID